MDTDSEEMERLLKRDFAELDFLERADPQEWAIEDPRILGEELLVISSEYAKFQDLQDRLDILGLDPDGKIVIVELKRDKADRTTDLQAINYASYLPLLLPKTSRRTTGTSGTSAARTNSLQKMLEKSSPNS